MTDMTELLEDLAYLSIIILKKIKCLYHRHLHVSLFIKSSPQFYLGIYHNRLKSMLVKGISVTKGQLGKWLLDS